MRRHRGTALVLSLVVVPALVGVRPPAAGAATRAAVPLRPVAALRATTTSPADEAKKWSAYVKAENAKPGTPGWQIPSNRAQPSSGFAGYADHVSARPGDAVRLFVHAKGRITATAYRIGWYGGVGARRIARAAFTASPQPAPRTVDDPIADAGGLRDAHVDQAPWRASATLTTRGWPEGMYVIRLDAASVSRYIPLTIRSASALGRLAVVSGIMTNEAYNHWGGHSLYHGPTGTSTGKALAVSFDRPYDRELGAGQSLYYDAPVVQQAERSGLPVAWLTDYDAATIPGLLAGAGGIIFGGHAEYWPVSLRDAVLQAQQAGTNLAVLGGNTSYWRARLAGHGLDLQHPDGRPRILVVTRSAALDPLSATDPAGTTVRYRDQPLPQPEQELMGARYLCSPATTDWVVTDPTWFGYRGTGVADGRHLARIVGSESDVAAPAEDEPPGVHVVAYNRFTCAGSPVAHTGVYYAAASGAGVFDAGTITWPCAIHRCTSSITAADAAVVARITTNVLTEFAVAKAGSRHPAVGDLSHYWLPTQPVAASPEA